MENDMNGGNEDEEILSPGSAIQIDVDHLPIGLKDSLTGVPQGMELPVLCSVLPIAGAYADGVEYRYCDNTIQKLNLMSIIVGPQASGKSICKRVVDIWREQMDQEDAVAFEEEEAWRAAHATRRANEKIDDKPKVCIRNVPIIISCSALLKRLKNNNGHCLYSFGEELDTLVRTNRDGSWSAKYDVYRYAFDNGEWGQDYVSDNAESGKVRVAYNWSVLGTEGALAKCFKSENIENGLSSRILLAEMPDCSFTRMPKYQPKSEAQDAVINQAVTILRQKKGFVDTPKIREAIENWVEQWRLRAMADDDHVVDTYRKRAGVIGMRCGIIAYLLNGEQETDAVIRFAVQMAQYTLDEQLLHFGDALQAALDGQLPKVAINRTANGSIFDHLPCEFTLDHLRELKPMDREHNLHVIVSRWKKNNWVEQTENGTWKKVEK